QMPKGVRGIRAETGLGAWDITKGPQLTVDLGRVDRLHVAWQQPDQRSNLPVVQVEESYLWDLRSPGASLSGILQYTVDKGTVSELAVGLPEGLEVRSVEVRQSSLAWSDAERGLLNREWHLAGKGNRRQLVVGLRRPATGSVQMLLELVPRLA